MRTIIFILCLLSLSVAGQAQNFAFQGVLRGPDGRTVTDGFQKVTFRIYDVATGGAAIWEEIHPSLETRNGLFNVSLGSITSLAAVPFNAAYYIGVQVEAFDELTPRISMAPTPYALAINGIDNKFPSVGDVEIKTNVNVANGDFNLNAGKLKLNGGASFIQFNDGTTLNTAKFGGPAGSLANTSSVLINANSEGGTAGEIQFQSNSSPLMRLHSSGILNLGLRATPLLGYGRFQVSGAPGAAGPHISYGTNADDHPLFQQLNWTHDNINMAFDAYYDGAAWRSSHAASNFSIYKLSNALNFNYAANVAPGSPLTWQTAMQISNVGNVGIRTGAPTFDLAIGDTDTGIDWISDGVMDIKSNGAARVLVRTNEVGIGVGPDYSWFPSANGNAYVSAAANGDVILRDRDSENLIVKGNGLVGIRTQPIANFDFAVGDSDTGIDWLGDGSMQIKANGVPRIAVDVDVNIVGNTWTGIGVPGANSHFPYLDGNVYISSQANADIIFRDGGSENIRFKANGYVGIGTTNPVVPLHVAQSVAYAMSNFHFMDQGSVGHFSQGNAWPVSIKADNRIAASAFHALSDERIKDIQGVSNPLKDLSLLSKLEVTDYFYIDKIGRTNTPQKKLIAQQVAKVYPQAVSFQEDFIPSIFEHAKSSTFNLDQKEATITTAKAHGLAKGDLVRVYNQGEELIEAKVLSIKDDNSFVIAHESQLENVFVYGKQVDDFHTVDYEAIAMLNVSATQALYKKVQALEEENAQLKKDVTSIKDLKAQNGTLQLQFEQLKAMVESLQKVQSVQTSTATSTKNSK